MKYSGKGKDGEQKAKKCIFCGITHKPKMWPAYTQECRKKETICRKCKKKKKKKKTNCKKKKKKKKKGTIGQPVVGVKKSVKQEHMLLRQ